VTTVFTPRQQSLIEGYFSLRQSSALKHETLPFECQSWHAVGKSMTRDGADGSRLIVYQTENDLEVCVIYPDGTQKNFAQPTVAS
jgi:hypothetical protein